MNEDTLKAYLSSKYQGAQSFLDNVIFPIFGEDDFEDEYEAEQLQTREDSRLITENTGIQSIKALGKIYVGAEPLQIFDVTVSDRVIMERNRVGVQQLIRRIMDQFSCAFMIFHYKSDVRWDWRFSFCHKKTSNADASDSKRFTYLLGPGQSCRTAAENFMTIYEKRGHIEVDDIEKAFSVEVLSKEFFGKYKGQYDKFVEYLSNPANGMRDSFIDTDFETKGLTPEKIRDLQEKPIRDYVKKLLGRIVFLHFLQKKGWLGVPADGDWGDGDRDFMLHLFEYATQKQKDNFLDEILEPLFNDAFDTNRSNSHDLFDTKVEGFRNVRIPYLNGGLFERDDLDKNDSWFPPRLFKELLDTFSQYNFTIDENDPNDAEVGVDPEMLGRIFENLLEDNKDKGAFYTPKEIVKYMCQESLIAYLQTDYVNEEVKGKIRKFVFSHNADELGSMKGAIDVKLREVKICDPAIGSGAFPMGLLRELFYCRCAIEPGAIDNAAKIKREIIQNNIYGVDIEKGAVDIARLRFWLSLIVEEKSPDTLPNLDFKIMQGNSLLEQYQGFDLSTLTKDPRKTEFDDDYGHQTAFYEDSVDMLRDILLEKLKKYYLCDDHNQRGKLRGEIADLVQRQIDTQNVDRSINNIDISANTEFFLWHTWFNDVFSRPKREGFDIVIGNPPYVSTKGVTGREKKIYEKEFGFSDDTYNLFTFMGHSICKNNGILSYIIPKTFWTIQTKRNMRELLLSNTLEYIYDTANPFEAAMVDTCIIQVRKKPVEEGHLVRFFDGTNNLTSPFAYKPINQSIYLNAQNMVIFKPNELNLRIYELYNDKVKKLYAQWWDKIKTSRDIEKNKDELKKYRESLKPGDVALLGCLTEGGQGLATANNGKYVAVRRSTRWANNITETRPKKLSEAIKKSKVEVPGLENFVNTKEFLESLSEKEIAVLFDSLKEKYGRDIFGQGYLYRIIDDDEIADVDFLSEDEKENGIDTSKKYYVPYDKGDKDGNRWYLETPFAIAWSKENVQFLKTNSGKKGEGMPVVRNPQFYFREGLCWSDISDTRIRCRIKKKGVYDVKSMSIFSVTNIPDEYFVCIINSKLMGNYIKSFINNTVSFQINDARQLPCVIPDKLQKDESIGFVKNAIESKRQSDCDNGIINCIQEEVDSFVELLYNLGR